MLLYNNTWVYPFLSLTWRRAYLRSCTWLFILPTRPSTCTPHPRNQQHPAAGRGIRRKAHWLAACWSCRLWYKYSATKKRFCACTIEGSERLTMAKLWWEQTLIQTGWVQAAIRGYSRANIKNCGTRRYCRAPYFQGHDYFAYE